MSEWIKTTNLCKHYSRGPQEVRAVDGVDLTVKRGEFLAVVGSSGSGKSTLLNLLAGLDTPTSGNIEFDGLALNSFSRRELSAYRAQRVGIVFQSFNLISYKTALENVELALYFASGKTNSRTSKATAILERLGLGDRLDHRPSDLSGGEQQRVAIARALVKSPEILFADEPTGNLDQENSIQISKLMAELNRDGLTVFMVTHDLELADKFATRHIRMHYGEIVNESTGSSR